MSASTEFEIKVSEGKIELPKNLPDGIYRRVRKVETPTVSNQEKVFVRIPVTELSINESWFKDYKPKTRREKELKEQIKTAIEKGLKDFWRPKYDPSFSDEERTKICYLPGKKPAIGKTFDWWEKISKEFLLECKSRLGTKTEYIAFLAVLIKELVASGWNIEKAWYAVCNDSRELGHYYNSKNEEHADLFEDIDCREICGFYDLAKTHKILTEDKETGGFWIASGDCFSDSHNNPLADLEYNNHRDCIDYFGTGWIVLEKDPYTTE